MQVLRVSNVGEALPEGLKLLRDSGQRRSSRNGGVRVMSEPVTTLYLKPTERVLFDPVRDANPFLHLFESLWMLAGRNDLEYIERFAKNMRNYSDDKKTVWGAYGWRWRKFFGYDQLAWALARLRKYPDDRRTVITMWDANSDPDVATNGGLDVPCNLSLHLQRTADGALDMTVFNRSNDAIWGAYGANAVHFSILQEYMAGALGLRVGRYWQVSDNFHAYDDLFEKLVPFADNWEQEFCPYFCGDVHVEPLGVKEGGEVAWDQDLLMFLEDPYAIGFRHRFFRQIATPMMAAFQHWKTQKGEDRYLGALEALARMPAGNDWRENAEQWIQRRYEKWQKADENASVE